jgi:Zn-dependent protease with chaperone function
MHLHLILLAIGLACTVRFLLFRPLAWPLRWQYPLGLFLFSPLLLLMTAAAVLEMGKQGQMLGLPVGQVGYAGALGFWVIAVALLLWRAIQGWQSVQQLRQYPTVELPNGETSTTGHLLDTAIPFAAQVGFWQPKLVISRGLLQFAPEQIEAVLTHEQAHARYRDTFWFFWLGWLRQLTVWLPNTERLWQELLLLREMRADRCAAQQVDALVLAEALLQMAQAPLEPEIMELENACAAISANATLTRLEERIDALLSDSDVPSHPSALPWVWVVLSLIPLLTVVLHQ